jgi:hypothetical protein
MDKNKDSSKFLLTNVFDIDMRERTFINSDKYTHRITECNYSSLFTDYYGNARYL